MTVLFRRSYSPKTVLFRRSFSLRLYCSDVPSPSRLYRSSVPSLSRLSGLVSCASFPGLDWHPLVRTRGPGRKNLEECFIVSSSCYFILSVQFLSLVSPARTLNYHRLYYSIAAASKISPACMTQPFTLLFGLFPSKNLYIPKNVLKCVWIFVYSKMVINIYKL